MFLNVLTTIDAQFEKKEVVLWRKNGRYLKEKKMHISLLKTFCNHHDGVF